MINYKQTLSEKCKTPLREENINFLKTLNVVKRADILGAYDDFKSDIPILPTDIRNKIIDEVISQHISTLQIGDCIITLFRDLPHSFDDKPAIVNINGTLEEWYNHGFLHRDGDMPSFISREDGRVTTQYYQNGKLHRENNEPASTIYKNGILIFAEWFNHGKKVSAKDLYKNIDKIDEIYRPYIIKKAISNLSLF